MCKTYDAIYKVAKDVESDVLILWVGHKKIMGKLLDCKDNSCLDEVVTLQDASIECMHEGGVSHKKTFRWLNIPSHHIKAFAFACCVIDTVDIE